MAGTAGGRSLAEWLQWQETLNPVEIDLGLERVAKVAAALALQPPPGRVFTVAGTNGKGSTAAALARLLNAAGLHTGVYTSPHLLRYNERIAIDGRPADDAVIVAAFASIDAARGNTPLTYFEFGTLAAFEVFSRQGCDAWVLEVGLGGRLDAVNIVAPDFALITTVDLDHQAWLGDDIEAIAAEKAGILRAGKPAFYGAPTVPAAVVARAAELGAPLAIAGRDFRARVDGEHWSWRGREHRLDGLVKPAGGDAQIANQSLALAAAEACDPALVRIMQSEPGLLADVAPAGRCQSWRESEELGGREWVLDVAHNPQAARTLSRWLTGRRPDTVVLGLLADKAVDEFVQALAVDPQHWIVCPTGGARGSEPAALRDRLAASVGGRVCTRDSVEAALARARELTPPGGQALVCGSFTVVGPALRWLGLYSGTTG